MDNIVEHTNLDYDINVRNDTLNRILSLLEDDYQSFYAYSDTIVIALALAYFGLSENYLISTDKTKEYLTDKHTPNISYHYLYDFFNNPNNKINYGSNDKSKMDSAALLAVIRNCLFHGMGSVDEKERKVHIFSDHTPNDIDASIPFYFFENYLREFLTHRINIESDEFYIFSCYKNRGYHVMGDPKGNATDYVFSNGILPIRIIPKSIKGNEQIESAIFQNFIYYYELVFSRTHEGKYDSFLDYFNDFKNGLYNAFREKFPNFDLEITLNAPADLNNLLYTSEKDPDYFDGKSLARELNRILYDLKNGKFEIITYLYKTILELNEIMKRNIHPIIMEHEGMQSKEYENDFLKGYSAFSTATSRKSDFLTIMLYVLGINTMLINGDRLYRSEDAFNSLDMKLFTRGEYNNNKDLSSSIARQIDVLEMEIAAYQEQLSTCKSLKGTDYLRSVIFEKKVKLGELNHLLDEKKVKEAVIHPGTNDKLDELAYNINANTINIGGKLYRETNDVLEVKRVMRNCFAHPDRIKVVKTSSGYNAEFYDVSDENEITSVGYADLFKLLYFLTQDEIIKKYGDFHQTNKVS